MSIIGEALLSAAINSLFKKLDSTDLLQFARREQLHADLQKWKNKLVMIKAVLADAEEKQATNPLVEIWLGKLQKLAYDVEDMIDEFATEALRRKLLDEPQASTSKVRKLIPTCCTGLNPRSLKLNSTMASQIKEITARLQQIVEDKNSFDLKENSGTRSNRARYQRPPATHLSDPHIYGRDHDKEAILELLLKDDGADAKFSVVSIEGFGGLGKTTLAQLAYNDARVKDHFDIKAWVCVSEDFDVVRITKAILQSTTDVDDLSMLHDKLKEKLSGKKFCFVLDDVWTENYEEWTILCRPFEVCSFGSKIVVTTRNHSVSSMVGASPAHRLEALSNDDCLSIFTHHSLGKMDFNEHQDLKEIGEKIVERCKGMPLAVKTLGGLLRSKVNSKDWKDVLDSNLWNLPEEKSSIMPALRVSYYYLPSHLKRCFAYCSLFPHDYVFHKEELILLWMAEGFLQTESGGKQAEDLGGEYFDDLHSRSFFQQSRIDYGFDDGFVMHDLINDLAQWAGKDFCCRIDTLQQGEKQWKITENIRHLCFLNDGSFDEFIRKSGALNEMKSVRTFLTPSNSWFSEGSYDFPCMVLQMQRLRVLSLTTRYPINELPKQIGDQKLLHHLDLSHSRIEFLPDLVNRFYNLETLVLKCCYHLKRLCSDMGNLIKLRHLYVSHAPLEGMPSRIGQLTCLRTLTVFVVGKNMGSGLRELKDLMDLRERLDISGLENVNDSDDAEKANFRGKGGLKDLKLKWTRSSDGSNEKEIADQVLEKLQPCQKLESLQILGYGGTRFPEWLGDTSLWSLVSLTFDDCGNCAFFPSIGQLPSLKKLVIRNMPEIESLGPEFYGNGCSTAPFQSLEEFDIENLHKWRDWIPWRNVEAFPRLRWLAIKNCPKLQGKLPGHLPSLESLSIEDCEQWSASVPMLPEHCYIQIFRCKEVVVQSSVKDCSLLRSMFHLLSGISSCMFLAEGFTKGFSKLERLEMVDYDKEIPLLEIVYDSEAASIYGHFGSFMIREEEEELQQQEEPCRVQYMALEDIKYPVKLEEAFRSLSFLRGLSISKSPNIISFQESSLPSQLRFIVLKECNALQSLPRAWMHSCNTYLKNLSISGCDSLTCIARVQLPPNLKRLHVKHCSNLLTVLEEEQVSGSCTNTPSLECLKIENCPSLTSLWSKSNELPDTLGKIKLSDCSNLATLASSGNLPKALRYLSITGCSKLESIAKTFHDNMKLEQLYMDDCEKLETLPSGINNLISLRELKIRSCPGVVSIPVGGFPTKVTVLDINGMEICKSLFEWGLHRLTSLEVLGISGCPDVLSFPQEETQMILPDSLTTLVIYDFPNLERISSDIQNLACFEKLRLINCPKLEYFPENGLPKSLKQLDIYSCPLLKEKCKEGEGVHWPMIGHLSDATSDYTSSDEGD